MLLKCIPNMHESSFGIAHHKNHESLHNMKQLKASALTLVYSCHVIHSEGSFSKQLMTFELKSCDKSMNWENSTFLFIANSVEDCGVPITNGPEIP